MIIILICFFIFLYLLYYFSRDDFVIVRKDISMERIFNLAFLTAIVSLFFSRLSFVLESLDPRLLNPLEFLAVPYFPGLSLIGGMLGAAIFIFLYGSFRKLPVGKMLDLFTLSFMGVLPLGLIGNFIVHLGKVSLFSNLIFIFSIFVLLLFAKIIYPFSGRGEIKDGTLGLMFGAIFSFLYFMTRLFLNLKDFSFLSLDNILILVVLFSSLILLVNQEIMDKFLAKK